MGLNCFFLFSRECKQLSMGEGCTTPPYRNPSPPPSLSPPASPTSQVHPLLLSLLSHLSVSEQPEHDDTEQTPLEATLSSIWDTASLSSQHADQLCELGTVRMVLSAFSRSPRPRTRELSLGILANLACWPGIPFDTVAADEDALCAMRSVIQGEESDGLVVREALRLLKNLLVLSLPDDALHDPPEPLFSSLSVPPSFLPALLLIVVTAVNRVVCEEAAETAIAYLRVIGADTHAVEIIGGDQGLGEVVADWVSEKLKSSMEKMDDEEVEEENRGLTTEEVDGEEEGNSYNTTLLELLVALKSTGLVRTHGGFV